MTESALDIYADAFVAPGRHELDSRPVVYVAPGVRGVAHIRLLITDDSGYDRLAAEIAGTWRGVILAFEEATRCHELMRAQTGWSASHPELAMVLRDIEKVMNARLPDGFELRPVNRGPFHAPGGVSLEEAVRVAIASDPSITGPAEGMVGYLETLPSSARLFVALDENGTACATAACHVFGEYAQVFFISTKPETRRRGVGSAMTVGVLRVAAHLGARKAILHATEDGAGIYRRLGFEPVGLLTRYWFPD